LLLSFTHRPFLPFFISHAWSFKLRNCQEHEPSVTSPSLHTYTRVEKHRSLSPNV
jgi:hypothetical protein